MSLQAEETVVAASAAYSNAAEMTTQDSLGGDDAASTRSESNLEEAHASPRGEIVDKVEDMDILCGRGW